MAESEGEGGATAMTARAGARAGTKGSEGRVDCSALGGAREQRWAGMGKVADAPGVWR